MVDTITKHLLFFHAHFCICLHIRYAPSGSEEEFKAKERNKSVVVTSYYHKGASHISQATAENAFSKVHLGHGLVTSIGAGEDVAVRSLIVSSGKDSDVHPPASKVPPNPPPSDSRR